MPASISEPVWMLAVLIAIFTTKHYIADFLLQTNWIAVGKDARHGWMLPLTAHTACHGALTLLIVGALVPRLWWLSFVDFGVHFVIDKAKAAVGHTTPLTPQQEKFWWLLGLDQYLHQLTNIGLSVAVVSL